MLLPPNVGRSVVNGELISRIVPDFSQLNPCFVQTPTTLYAASRIYPENARNIFYLPYLPRIRKVENATYFQGVTQREHKKILQLVGAAKDKIVSIDTIGEQNKTGADWWSDWYGFHESQQRKFDVIWKYDTGDHNQAKLATYIVEARHASVFKIDIFAKRFAKIFLSVHVMALVDTDEEIIQIKSYLDGIDNLSLQIVDRRELSAWERWKILSKMGLSLIGNKTPIQHAPNRSQVSSAQVVEVFEEAPKKLLSPRQNLLGQTQQFTDNMNRFLAEQENIDGVLSFDVLSAVAGENVSRAFNNVHIVDVNEAPDYSNRVGKGFTSLTETEMETLKKLTQTGMESASASTSSSLILGQGSERIFGVKNRPVRSFHEWAPLTNDGQMKRDFDIPDSATTLVHCCTLAEEYGSSLLIDVMAKLDENFHLVIVGRFINEDYKQAFVEKLQAHKLEHRIHLRGTLDDPSQYLSYLSQADIGLIILDPSISTVSNGLSNRFVDLMAAGRPVVATPAQESDLIISEMGIGKVTAFTVKDIVRGVYQLSTEILSGKDYSEASEHARKKYAAAEERTRFQLMFAEVEKTDFILFIFQRGLSNNKRIMRLAGYLLDAGHKVVIASGVRPPVTIREKNNRITFVQVPANRPWTERQLAAEQALLSKVSHDV